MNWFNMLSMASRKPEGPILSPHQEFFMESDGEGLGFKYSEDFYSGTPNGLNSNYKYKEIFRNLVPGDTISITLSLWSVTTSSNLATSPKYMWLASGLSSSNLDWKQIYTCISNGRFRNATNNNISVTEYTYTYTIPDESENGFGFMVNNSYLSSDQTHALTSIKSINFVLN